MVSSIRGYDMPRKQSKNKSEPKSKAQKKRAVRVRFTERYLMCFGRTTGIIDLSNWEGSALYNTEKESFEVNNEWIYNMRDGDGDYYYIYNRKLTEEMCDMLFDDRPAWF